jgi:hypothetical protein
MGRKKGQPTGKQQRRERARLRIVRTVQDFWSEWEECPLSEDYIAAHPQAVEQGDRMFWNSRYHVWRRDFHSESFGGTITHLSIKRNDKEPLHDWRDLQRIKNELCGEEREAFELYPSESRVVDMANQYHLWVLPEGMVVPLGFFEGRQTGTPREAEKIGAKQRPFEK